MITYQDDTTSLKPEVGQTDAEDNVVLVNSNALNVIFNGVDNNMFKLINTCTEAKVAWEILKIGHKGTSKVRMSRLQLLTKKFVSLRMDEDGSICDFNIRLRGIANNLFALGEKMSKKKLVR